MLDLLHHVAVVTWMVLLGISALGDHTYSGVIMLGISAMGDQLPTRLDSAYGPAWYIRVGGPYTF